MKLIELTNEKLVLTEVEAQDNHDAISILGKRLYEEGYVKGTYIEAVIEREKKYPTGIQGVGINIAIPHTESEHVIKPGIAVGVLKHEILFNKIDNPGEWLNVKVVFLLAIKKPELHLEALKGIMNIFQDTEIIRSICTCKSSEEIISIIKKEDK